MRVMSHPANHIKKTYEKSNSNLRGTFKNLGDFTLNKSFTKNFFLIFGFIFII